MTAPQVPNQPDVAVVIPYAGGNATLLSEQLKALSLQLDAPSFSVIVVANSVDALSEFPALSEIELTIRVVDASAVAGPSVARNAGWRACEATKILYCDADDIVSERWVASMSSSLDEYEIVGGPLLYFSDSDLQLGGAVGAPAIQKKFGDIPFAQSSNIAIRRSVLEALDGWDESLSAAEDVEFCHRAVRSGFSLGAADSAIVHYRLRGTLRGVYSQFRGYGIGDICLRRTATGNVGRSLVSWRWVIVTLAILPLGWLPRFRRSTASRLGLAAGWMIGATRPAGSSPVMRVVHVGQFGAYPGGMAQVVNRYLSWTFDELSIVGCRTTRGRRDILAPLLTLQTMLRIAWFSQSRLPSVVVVHLSERGSFIREGAMLRLARCLGLPAIAHLHGAHFVEFAAAHSKTVSWVLARATHIAALSEASASAADLVVAGRVPVTIVRNGVDVPAQIPSPKQPLIVFGGELSERKGVDVLLAAWTELASEFPDWRLVLAGPASASVQAAVSQSESATYLGSLSHIDLLDYIRRSSVAVLPSRDEALPMFLLESLANGCALIGTRVGSVASIVNDTNGWLIEPGDASALRDALREALSLNSEQRERLQRGSHERALCAYSEDVVKKELTGLWRSALPSQSPSKGRAG